MNSLPWVVIVGIILLVTLVLFAISSDKNKKDKPNYFTLFVMGLFWVMIGIFAEIVPLWVMGLVFTFVGVSHKSEWKENDKEWKKMTENERKIRFLSAGILGTMFLLGIIVLYLARMAF